MSRAEKTFIALSGLKGAVPVLLAAFAILGGAPDAQRIYGLVFVAVLVSVVGQGTLVPSVARDSASRCPAGPAALGAVGPRRPGADWGARVRGGSGLARHGTALGDLPSAGTPG